MVFFGLAYFAQGVAGGLAKQPLTYYCKSLGMTADAVAAFFALAAVPWMLKPLYGLVTDFVPLWGYRRKSHLILMAGLGAMGFLWMSWCSSTNLLAPALLIATLGIAAIDVVVDALMVERGLTLGLIRQFQGQQWTWLNLAAVTTALIGGWLSHDLEPSEAVQTAALLMAGAPAIVIFAAWRLVDEPKIAPQSTRIRSTASDLVAAWRSKTLWTVAGFLAFWNLIPNFGTPLYYHMSDRLHFDQYFIGELISVGSFGAILGAMAYRRYGAAQFTTRQWLTLSIACNAAMALAYLCLRDPQSAVLLHLAGGIVSMIGLLTLFSLAASVCPPQAAGCTFAALMAVYSAAAQVSAIMGGHLYETVFHREIGPLICLAAVCTLAALAWVPFLPFEDVSPRALTNKRCCVA
ncbi:MAG TPA: MFS transporter [Nitrospira sp.]|nr:MFS transporter [Nitrospira sp.]